MDGFIIESFLGQLLTIKAMLMHNFVYELRARAFYNWNGRIKAGLPFEAKRFPCSQNDLTLVDPALKCPARNRIAVISHVIQYFLRIKAAVTGSVHPNPSATPV